MTVKYSQKESQPGGFNDLVRVTPLTISGTTRIELPEGGRIAQLAGRGNIMVQNTDSGTVWIGDMSVGFSGDSTECSGVQISAGSSFTLDAGRLRLYAYNEETYDVNIKLMEVK